ncbi:hypothetical protein ACWCOU_29930, partial [Actinomadura luteofluorescens]
LPRPLRSVLGARARAMDRITRDAAEAGGAVHAPMDEAMARDPRLFAADGFHPSAAGYRAWARDLARAAFPTPASAPATGPGAAGPGEPPQDTPPAGAVPPRTAD